MVISTISPIIGFHLALSPMMAISKCLEPGSQVHAFTTNLFVTMEGLVVGAPPTTCIEVLSSSINFSAVPELLHHLQHISRYDIDGYLSCYKTINNIQNEYQSLYSSLKSPG